MNRVMEEFKKLANSRSVDLPVPERAYYYDTGIGPNILRLKFYRQSRPAGLWEHYVRHIHLRNLSDVEVGRECHGREEIEGRDPLYKMLRNIDAFYEVNVRRNRQSWPFEMSPPEVGGRNVHRVMGEIKRRELDEKSYTALLNAATQRLQKLDEQRDEEMKPKNTETKQNGGEKR